jgi:DinB superfamily
MNPLEALAAQAEWVARNLAYNLDFIPADKLAWKPAPSAKSALEVVNHTAGAFKGMQPVLSGGSFTPGNFTPATTVAAAKELIIGAATDFAAALRKVNPEDLGKQIELPFGSFTLARVATFPVFDVMHHHGQIAYIQTLLGDNEDHFDMSLM